MVRNHSAAAVLGLSLSDVNFNISCFVHNNGFCFLQVWCPAVFASSGHLVLSNVGLQNTLSYQVSPRAHFNSRGGDVKVYVFDINQPSLPTPFYFVLVSVSVFMALSTVFHSINSPNNSPLSHSVLLVLFLLFLLLVIFPTTYLFTKVSLSPDIILCG